MAASLKRAQQGITRGLAEESTYTAHLGRPGQ